MKPIGPNVNSYGGSLNDIKDLDFQSRSENIDPPPGFCDQPPDNQNNVGLNNPDDWMQDLFINKTGNGQENNADPFQRGQIVNDLNVPNRNTIYRYAKSIRGTDEAVMDLFRNIVVIDDDGKAHPVPVIWATQERAVAAVVQENVRKDDTLVVDRIKLPMLAISSTDFTFNQEWYTYHKALNWAPDTQGKPTFTVSEKYNKDTVFGVARGIPIDISYNLIQNRDLPYNKYNLYRVINNIVSINNIIQEDNKIKIFKLGILNYDKFYELSNLKKKS